MYLQAEEADNAERGQVKPIGEHVHQPLHCIVWTDRLLCELHQQQVTDGRLCGGNLFEFIWRGTGGKGEDERERDRDRETESWERVGRVAYGQCRERAYPKGFIFKMDTLNYGMSFVLIKLLVNYWLNSVLAIW